MTTPGPWQHPPRRRKASRLGLALWLGALAALGLSIWLLGQYFPGQSSPMDEMAMVRLLAILAVSSSGLLFIRGVNLKQTARNVLMWLVVGGVVLLGYSYQDMLTDTVLRLRSAVIPGYPLESGTHEMVLSEGDGGSYFVYGEVNDTRVRFLVDTGASDIVLSPSDADRIGIDRRNLDFRRNYETANGIGQGAGFVVDRLAVGNIRMSNVPVSVNQAGMSSSLLGMAFLRRLKTFRFSQHKLYLSW